MYLDGNQVATVDGYSPGTEFQQVLYSVSGLADTSHTLKIVVSGQKNPASGGTYVSIDAINVPTAAQAADYYPVVPQAAGTGITLQGRDAKLLLANDAFAGQQLVYSTSELMTQAQIGSQAVALLYGPAGTDGETVLRYSSQPTVKVLSGNVTSTWDATRGDLRLDYVHNGLAKVQITGGGRPALLLLLAQKTVAEEFWPESTSAGPVLVRGGYLVRGAQANGSTTRADRRHQPAGDADGVGAASDQRRHVERAPGGDDGPPQRVTHRQRRRTGAGHPARARKLALQLRDAGGSARLRRQLLDARRPSGHHQPDQAGDHAGPVRRRLRVPHRVRLVPRTLHRDRERDRDQPDRRRRNPRRVLGLAERRVPRL